MNLHVSLNLRFEISNYRWHCPAILDEHVTLTVKTAGSAPHLSKADG